MTDYTWPVDLIPYAQTFYLQPHTGGTESPFSRQTKVYGLSAPRWVCSVIFRGGYNGLRDQAAYGPRLDALLARLKGRQNRVALWDFRRPVFRGGVPLGIGNVAASAGASIITFTGLAPGTKIYNGDYFGGDGRPHIISSGLFESIATVADASGNATVTFEPPLAANIGTNAVIFERAPGWFRITDDDAGGTNGVEVGTAVDMKLDFVEDLT